MIYFIQAGDNGPIKIGLTSKSASHRLRQFQTGIPQSLSVLAEVEGGRQHEAALHGKFSEFGIRGEWFTPDPELLDFISFVVASNELPPDLVREVSTIRVMFIHVTPGKGVNFRAELDKAIAKAGTKTAFARKADISQQYLSDILADRRPPSDKVLDAMGLERIIRRKPKP